MHVDLAVWGTVFVVEHLGNAQIVPGHAGRAACILTIYFGPAKKDTAVLAERHETIFTRLFGISGGAKPTRARPAQNFTITPTSLGVASKTAEHILRTKKPKQKYELQAETALVRLRAERVKLKALAYVLKAKADRKHYLEDSDSQKKILALEDLKNECFRIEIESLQKQLGNALEELTKLRKQSR